MGQESCAGFGAAFLLIYGGRLILGDPRMEIAVGESLMARPFIDSEAGSLTSENE